MKEGRIISMCGIVGHIRKDNENVTPYVMGGIERLLHRGYDSGGIAGIDNSCNLWIHKAVCDSREGLTPLKIKVSQINPEGAVAIGHTRWATHGGVTDENAHPHTDCQQRIAVVHNGTIQNWEELRTRLAIQGHTFLSETDTEVIPHLIEEEFLKNPNLKLEEAVKKALHEVVGAYSIAVISVYDPQKIVVAMNAAALLIGIGSGMHMIASDRQALLGHTQEMVVLHPGELAVVRADRYDVFALNGDRVKKSILPLEEKCPDMSKSGHEHFTHKEIHSIPQVLHDSFRGRARENMYDVHLGGLEDSRGMLSMINRIVIPACGTSMHAAIAGKYMLQTYAHIPVEVVPASEFLYGDPVLDQQSLVLAVSQSGETADTLEAVREAARMGIPRLGIINVPASAIALATGTGIYTRAGWEVGVASTKAFIAQCVAFAQLAIWLGRSRNVLGVSESSMLIEEMLQLPKKAERVLEKEAQIFQLAEVYATYKTFLSLGRRYGLAAAMEAALKLKELAYVHAEACPSGELKHGVLALIQKDRPVLVTVPKDDKIVYPKIISNMKEIEAREGKILAVATEGDTCVSRTAKDVIFVPPTQEMFVPILYTIPWYLFSYHLARVLGNEIDRPRNLAKSVTVE